MLCIRTTNDAMIPTVIRWLLTTALLSVVWLSAHWSVALAITGLSMANEALWWTVNEDRR